MVGLSGTVADVAKPAKEEQHCRTFSTTKTCQPCAMITQSDVCTFLTETGCSIEVLVGVPKVSKS